MLLSDVAFWRLRYFFLLKLRDLLLEVTADPSFDYYLEGFSKRNHNYNLHKVCISIAIDLTYYSENSSTNPNNQYWIDYVKKYASDADVIRPVYQIVKRGATHTRAAAQMVRTQRQSVRRRAPKLDLDLITRILKVASHNGGSTIAGLRISANASSKWIEKSVSLLVQRKLLSVETSFTRNKKFYRPTDLGYAFLLKQRELVSLLDSCDDPNLLHFWE